jgi:hypothetical protein
LGDRRSRELRRNEGGERRAFERAFAELDARITDFLAAELG